MNDDVIVKHDMHSVNRTLHVLFQYYSLNKNLFHSKKNTTHKTYSFFQSKHGLGLEIVSIL